MKKAVYVSSTQTFSGKTALCVGMINHFKAKGHDVGYMKPVSANARRTGKTFLDEDARFIKDLLNSPLPMEVLTPVILNDRGIKALLDSGLSELKDKVKKAFELVSNNCELVILEGGGSLREGKIADLSPPETGRLLGAPHLVVIPYQTDLQVMDDLLTAQLRLGNDLIGAVINSVPEHKMETVTNVIKPYAEKRGVRILGTLPRVRTLMSISVAELKEGLGGTILCAGHNLDGLVEHIMIGAMAADSALAYFRRKGNKAVITGGDRPDIQLAALETSTKCLILTGNLKPSPLILGRAEEKGVAVILIPHDTMTAVEIIESFFGKVGFHQEEKIKLMEELLKTHLDFASMETIMGL